MSRRIRDHGGRIPILLHAGSAQYSEMRHACKLSGKENVAHLAQRYLNAGQDERLHALLHKALERLAHINHGESHILGLDTSG